MMGDNYTFSFFRAPVSNITPERGITLTEAYNYIRSTEAKERTLALRAVGSPEEARGYKSKNFDYCTFSGLFKNRSVSGLIQHSGLICIDFDHVPDVSALKRKLLAHEYFETILMFTSPSGDGVKWVIKADVKDTQEHSNFYNAMVSCFKMTGLPALDTACRDVARACFLPYDPEVYITPVLLGASDAQTPKKPFNPNDWLEQPEKIKVQSQAPYIHNNVEGCIDDDVERVVTRIEEQRIDVAPDYNDWVRLGFALADEFGESGRRYFLRLSALHPDCTSEAAEKQYSRCLHSAGHGITIATFFQLAKWAGIAISRPRDEWQNGKMATSYPDNDYCQIAKLPNCQVDKESILTDFESEGDDLPSFKDEVYDNLPPFLAEVMGHNITGTGRDMVLLTALTTISATLDNVCGVYHNVPTYSNLFLFVIADAGMGKSEMALCEELVLPIDEELNNKNQGLESSSDSDKKESMPHYTLIVGGNSSSSSMIKHLKDNEKGILIFETEADALSCTLKKEYGDFSYVLRQAFEHERVSQNRRKFNENLRISHPRLSVVLSGTPKQLVNLIPESENGLFSRFMYCYLPFREAFDDVFATMDPQSSKKILFKRSGERYKSLLNSRKRDDMKYVITLPVNLQRHFHEHYKRLNSQYCAIARGLQSVVRRNGLISYRIMMILTFLRYLTGDGIQPREDEMNITLECCESDYHTALSIAETLLVHSEFFFRHLEGLKVATRGPFKNLRQTTLYNLLPDTFSKKEYDEYVAQLNYSYDTCNKWLSPWGYFMKNGLLHKNAHGQYQKTNANYK